MHTLDEARVGAFMEKALGDAAGLFAGVLTMLGDRLGLFRALATDGPATAAELAGRAGVNERYALEWLRGLRAAGYLEQEPDGRFTSPPSTPRCSPWRAGRSSSAAPTR